jgi:hypothetical protein
MRRWERVLDGQVSRRDCAKGVSRRCLYHGWADNVVSPLSSLNYYKRVQEVVGEEETDEFLRIFRAPGMYHCGGGPGPNEFDMVLAIEDWVEKGKAPDRVIASHKTDGKVDRTRPLCPYPQAASYGSSKNCFLCSTRLLRGTSRKELRIFGNQREY